MFDICKLWRKCQRMKKLYKSKKQLIKHLNEFFEMHFTNKYLNFNSINMYIRPDYKLCETNSPGFYYISIENALDCVKIIKFGVENGSFEAFKFYIALINKIKRIRLRDIYRFNTSRRIRSEADKARRHLEKVNRIKKSLEEVKNKYENMRQVYNLFEETKLIKYMTLYYSEAEKEYGPGILLYINNYLVNYYDNLGSTKCIYWIKRRIKYKENLNYYHFIRYGGAKRCYSLLAYLQLKYLKYQDAFISWKTILEEYYSIYPQFIYKNIFGEVFKLKLRDKNLKEFCEIFTSNPQKFHVPGGVYKFISFLYKNNLPCLHIELLKINKDFYPYFYYKFLYEKHISDFDGLLISPKKLGSDIKYRESIIIEDLLKKYLNYLILDGETFNESPIIILYKKLREFHNTKLVDYKNLIELISLYL